MPSVARCLIVSMILSIGAAGAALGAANGSYSGRTSQAERVSFRISGGSVRNFKITVDDRCPDGHTLSVGSTYPAMKIAHGKFGGMFVPVGGHRGERAQLSGTVGRTTVSGSISDTSYSLREGALCHGSSRFTARRT